MMLREGGVREEWEEWLGNDEVKILSRDNRALCLEPYYC